MFGRTPFPKIGDSPYFLTLSPHASLWLLLQEYHSSDQSDRHLELGTPAPERPPALRIDVEARADAVRDRDRRVASRCSHRRVPGCNCDTRFFRRSANKLPNFPEPPDGASLYVKRRGVPRVERTGRHYDVRKRDPASAGDGAAVRLRERRCRRGGPRGAAAGGDRRLHTLRSADSGGAPVRRPARTRARRDRTLPRGARARAGLSRGARPGAGPRLPGVGRAAPSTLRRCSRRRSGRDPGARGRAGRAGAGTPPRCWER